MNVNIIIIILIVKKSEIAVLKRKKKRNLKKTNRSKFKGNNSRITILDINKSGKNDNKSTSNNSTNRAFQILKKNQ